MLRFSCAILLGVFCLQFESETIFFRKMKKKFSDRIVTKDWKLSLNSNAKFEYMIINKIELCSGKGNITKDTTFYNGLWRYDGDTLFLYSDACPGKEIKYLRKSRFLYSLRSCIDTFYNKKMVKLRLLK